jgi:hypothetical protein
MTDVQSPKGWQNRIIGHGAEDPLQLLANPKNARIHPQAQQEALSSVLDDIGWVASVKVNQRTGFVVDGHARVALAITKAESTIPVDYLDLTDEEEALVLATFDTLGAQATSDPEQLRALLDEVQPKAEALASLLERLASDTEFKPTLAPTIELREVTDKDVSRTEDKLANAFAQKDKEMTEVQCPKCGCSFYED